jgi:sialic acid synthase SpsE/mannose-6-phosphate isomerase-like protein (cupin superfamily)
MDKNFDFKDLFIFEMANNHQGSVEHGRRIIREVSEVAHAENIRAAVKFQFRQLDSLIHPSHRQSSTNKHIPRFQSTRLSKEQFGMLIEEVRKRELIVTCTPFDEESVDMIVDLGIDVVKIGSCSATDWPLIEKIAECDKPVIFSTGGLTLKQIDDLVSFFDHRRVHHAMMHCVSLYPTPDDKLQLNQISVLCRRYPEKVIGFSTHESPDDCEPVKVAVAKGARMFERHVGVEADGIKLNSYSSTPDQLRNWVKSYKRARVLCGDLQRPQASAEERDSLQSLKRGVYALKSLKRGTAVKRNDVYFAMPCETGQLSSGEWKEGIVAVDEVGKDQAVMIRAVEVPDDPDKQVLFTAIHTIKGMLSESRIPLNTEFRAEFSHHYGISRFLEIGATIIECINRDYCKKLIVQLPGQRHPAHFHKKKEETFQILYGRLEVEIEGRRRTLYPGDIHLVQQGVWHEFWTETGAIIEEISTTHYNDDSFYADKVINRMERSKRKTVVNNWGRYQI